MPEATCQRCGELFYRESTETWKRLCWSCWREREDGKKSDAYQAGYRAGLDAGRREPRPTPHRPPPPDPVAPELVEHLPRLLQLCHPDRHGNSESATRATQWLLLMRQKLRNHP